MPSIKRCTAINTSTGAVTFVDVDLAGGPAGPPGPGVPTGGTANQILSKVDATNYNTQWVTPSAGSVADGSITNAKLATMPTLTMKGNVTGATAAPTDLTASQVKTILALTKTDVGLGSVDNTTDATKPVSTPQQTALNGKVDTTRTISVTAPITGGGDLSANRSIGITLFAGSSAGAVPTSVGGTTNFLRADGSWAAPPGGGGLSQATADTLYSPLRQIITAFSAATTAYTLLLTDEAKLLLFSAATQITLTVPLNSTVALPVGARIDLGQSGSGKVVVQGAAGTAVYCTPSATLRATGSMASLVKVVSPDTWFLTGDLA